MCGITGLWMCDGQQLGRRQDNQLAATVGGIALSIAAAYVAGAFNNIMEVLQLVFAFVRFCSTTRQKVHPFRLGQKHCLWPRIVPNTSAK